MSHLYVLNGVIVDHGHLERLDDHEVFVNGWDEPFVFGWCRDDDGLIGAFTPESKAAGRHGWESTPVCVNIGDMLHVADVGLFVVAAPHSSAVSQVPRVVEIAVVHVARRVAA